MECEFPRHRATSEEIAGILRAYKTVALVGISDKPERPSYQVAKYLKHAGYTIIPVNPKLEQVLGEQCYPALSAIDKPVEIVDIFRKAEAVPEIVEQAIAIKAKAIWMQEGVVHNKAAERALEAGLKVVMNRCMLKEHRAL